MDRSGRIRQCRACGCMFTVVPYCDAGTWCGGLLQQCAALVGALRQAPLLTVPVRKGAASVAAGQPGGDFRRPCHGTSHHAVTVCAPSVQFAADAPGGQVRHLEQARGIQLEVGKDIRRARGQLLQDVCMVGG